MLFVNANGQARSRRSLQVIRPPALASLSGMSQRGWTLRRCEDGVREVDEQQRSTEVLPYKHGKETEGQETERKRRVILHQYREAPATIAYEIMATGDGLCHRTMSQNNIHLQQRS